MGIGTDPGLLDKAPKTACQDGDEVRKAFFLGSRGMPFQPSRGLGSCKPVERKTSTIVRRPLTEANRLLRQRDPEGRALLVEGRFVFE